MAKDTSNFKHSTKETNPSIYPYFLPFYFTSPTPFPQHIHTLKKGKKMREVTKIKQLSISKGLVQIQQQFVKVEILISYKNKENWFPNPDPDVSRLRYTNRTEKSMSNLLWYKMHLH